MTEWTEAYKKAHAALKDTQTAIEKLVTATESPDKLRDRLCCAGNALHGVRALLEEAGNERSVPRPRIALNVAKVLKVARLNRGKKRRMSWDSGEDVFKQLDEMHKKNPAETRLLIAALEDGVKQAFHNGLMLIPGGPPPQSGSING